MLPSFCSPVFVNDHLKRPVVNSKASGRNQGVPRHTTVPSSQEMISRP